MTASAFRLTALLFLAALTRANANELEGVWLFEKEINTTVTGEVVEIPGPMYVGMLIYTPDGYVSVNLMPKDRTWKVDNAKLEELRQTVGQGSSTGYAGRYEVDVKTRTVTHVPRVSLDPADEGARLARGYVLEGDRLTLSGTWTYQGRKLFFAVLWIRADSGDHAKQSSQ
jgi:hypothetical protein